MDTLTADISALNGRFDQMTARVDQLAAHSEALDRRFEKVADAIEALTSAQARTDEQIRLLLDRNGSSQGN